MSAFHSAHTTPRLGRIIQRKGGTERLPVSPVKELPRDRQIAGGITHGSPEVDDSAQLAILNQQIPGGNVSVEPDR